MNKKKISALVAVFVVLLCAAGWMFWQRLCANPIIRETTWVYIHDGVVEPAEVLQPREVQWALRCCGFEKKLEQHQMNGAYRLEAGMTAMKVARTITRHRQTPVRITFNNIRTKEQWASRVSKQLMCDSTALMDALLDPTFLDFVAETDTANVIGLLLPDTYEVYWNVSAHRLVLNMGWEYRHFWNESRKLKAEALGLTPQEVTILASIAEEETLDRAERGKVAMLYWNRLQLGMPLQADPTIKFALGDFSLTRILNQHLEVESPYNTYRNEGLPPGPIRMPEKATIDSILNARVHPYLYMCAKPDFSGTHNFATTYSEHQRNAAAYHRALSKLKDKK